ncbi:flavodoxin [Haloimpatiens sp. FM7330]|uniref:flavodoxin n=1 Tax=Haloimpatiens sp. FM7330 TaxID=3298610 RepID=UPI00362F4D9E
MINLCIINGSPRKERSNSSYLVRELTKLLDTDIEIKEYFVGNLLKNKNLLNEILSFDKIIFTSPLYADCFPSIMLEFMATFEDFIKEKNNTRIGMYGLVNCGFLEGTQNRTALNILKNYSKRINFNWRFGIGIGGGEFMGGSKNMPINSRMKRPIYTAFLSLKKDIENESTTPMNNILVSPKMPKFLFKTAANMGWKSMAKKNNLKPKDLYKRIY